MEDLMQFKYTKVKKQPEPDDYQLDQKQDANDMFSDIFGETVQEDIEIKKSVGREEIIRKVQETS